VPSHAEVGDGTGSRSLRENKKKKKDKNMISESKHKLTMEGELVINTLSMVWGWGIKTELRLV
jgi:hypothetical protein